MTRRLIVALDTTDVGHAQRIASAVRPYAGLLKIGLEFYLANGADGFRSLASGPIFLDLKLHDIPNTVSGAVKAVLPLGPRMLTVHASGGTAMVAAARAAADTVTEHRPIILAVTVLTSLDASALTAMGFPGSPKDMVLQLGETAIQAGADGLVCSPQEVRSLRAALGPDVKLVVPGIRPDGAEKGDQARTMGPAEAIAAGADWIVVGRPITAAPDPAEAARRIQEAIQ